MAIVPMTKIRFYVHRSNRGKRLDLLQEKGVTQVYELENIENTKKENVSGEISLLDRQLGAVKSSLGVLAEFDDEKKPLFSTRKPIAKAAYASMKKEADSVLKIAAKINSLSKGVAEKRANIARLRALIASYEPWINFDLPLNFSGTMQTATLIGIVTTELSFDAFCSEVEQAFENVYIS